MAEPNFMAVHPVVVDIVQFSTDPLMAHLNVKIFHILHLNEENPKDLMEKKRELKQCFRQLRSGNGSNIT